MKALAPESRVNLTVMLVSHDAFRRDLRRLEHAAGRRSVGEPAGRRRVLTGWEIFKTQLHIHHEGEDRDLWPRMQRGLAHRPHVLGTLRELEQEHSQMEPLLAAVDTALNDEETSHDGLADPINALAGALESHLKHEEEEGLPYVAEAVSDAEWKSFLADQRKNLGLTGAAEFFPWLLDEATPENAARVTSLMPPPMKLVMKRIWMPRYLARVAWD